MSMVPTRLRTTLVSLVFLTVACAVSSEMPETAEDQEPGLPAGHPVIDGPGAEGSLSGEETGVVLETQDGGGYTYARVDFDGVERWIAGPPVVLVAGDTVSVLDMVNMGRFQSDGLGREFDELFFTSGFRRAGPGAAPAEGGLQYEGSVEEVLVTQSYVIALVDSGEESVWIAAPVTEIHEGDRIGWNAGSLMTGFWSPSLERSFDEILFVSRVFVLN
jgi:hypothetical protein